MRREAIPTASLSRLLTSWTIPTPERRWAEPGRSEFGRRLAWEYSERELERAYDRVLDMNAARPTTAVPAVLDPVNDSRWRDFVDAVPGAGIFHHPTWLSVIQRRYGYPVAACSLLAADGSVQRGFPWRWCAPPSAARLVAFPFSDLCQPLGTPEDLEALGSVAADLRRQMGASMEVRGPSTRPARGPALDTGTTF